MKRLKIWLSNFSLIQQFLAIVFLTATVLTLFIVAFLNKNVDTFVNDQMYVYIHKAQAEYMINSFNNSDNNVVHFVYDASQKMYLNAIHGEYVEILKNINPNIEQNELDSYFNYNDKSIVYSIVSYKDNYRLISIVKNDYRNEFRNALVTGVVNTTVYVFLSLIFLIFLWVVSLIRPLNSIKNFINKIRLGENAQIDLVRYDEIGEVSEALTSMNEELSKQQHIRDEMIQNISHDLKTPIATIKSYSESIKDGIYPYDTLEKSVDVISENANRLEKKVYSLITYNKLGYLSDSNDDYLNLDMKQVINKAILTCSVLRNDIKIDALLQDDVCFHGEEEAWRVVVENLLDNALRYAKSIVRIVLNKNVLEIYNDGETMDEERIAKLFKPYEKGTNGKFGLGLSIVKKVCDTYGYIVVGENMSDGVIFRIYTTKKFKKLPKKKIKKV